MKAVTVARTGALSVADHLAEMRGWLAERGITPRELNIVHVLNLRIVIRAVFDTDEQAEAFREEFSSVSRPSISGQISSDRNNMSRPDALLRPDSSTVTAKAGHVVRLSSLSSLWLWFSVCWIAAVLLFESADGEMGAELVEVFSAAAVPTLLPPLMLWVLMAFRAERTAA